MYVKGAPDRLFPLCKSQMVDDSMVTLSATAGNTTSFQEGVWIQHQEQLSSQGLRVLALCRWVS
jgi:magnesium-transporting ATPase (P-type)